MRDIHVVVQPDTASFTQRCGRPWFSAGAWLPRQGMICLPPPRVLEKRPDLDAELRHEIAHALLHEQLAGCPLWFIEGLMLHLAGQRPQPQRDIVFADQVAHERALNAPRCPREAASAYHQAHAMLARLAMQAELIALIGACPTLCSHLDRATLAFFPSK